MEASDELPSGGVFKVVSLESFPGFDYDRVALEPETNPVQAYDHLSFGGTIWKENGELVEDAGQSFNLGAYLSGIQDADGNSVPFTVSPSGERKRRRSSCWARGGWSGRTFPSRRRPSATRSARTAAPSRWAPA